MSYNSIVGKIPSNWNGKRSFLPWGPNPPRCTAEGSQRLGAVTLSLRERACPPLSRSRSIQRGKSRGEVAAYPRASPPRSGRFGRAALFRSSACRAARLRSAGLPGPRRCPGGRTGTPLGTETRLRLSSYRGRAPPTPPHSTAPEHLCRRRFTGITATEHISLDSGHVLNHISKELS